jgi:hypothetical protein
MTTPPGYTGNQTDTSGVSGNTGAAPDGTQDNASVTETSTPSGYGGDPDTGLKPDPLVQVSTGTSDTSGTNSSNAGPFTASKNYLTGTPDTQTIGWPQTPGVTQPYRPPTQGIGYINATGAADTTWTDRPISNGTARPDYVQNMTGTLESALIGSTGPTSALVPVAPSGTPTVVTGPRQVTVSWNTVADPDVTAPVTGYIILGSTGGTTYVGDGVTSAVVTNLDPSRTYQFRVLARNKNGDGPYGALSAAVRPYNPDAPDVLKPGGLDAYWAQNPIYSPDGTVKAGSGTLGTPGAPTGVTLSGGGAGTLNVTWVAPADASEVRSYTVTLSTGQTKSVAAGTLTTSFTGLTTGTATTARVTSVGSVGSTQSAPSASVNVP